eukprot:364744-Chlamydomonas_euryale.AAC.4
MACCSNQMACCSNLVCRLRLYLSAPAPGRAHPILGQSSSQVQWHSPQFTPLPLATLGPGFPS